MANSVIRRCRLNVRFARKRTRLTDFMSKFTGSLRILVWFGPGRRRPGPLASCKNESKSWALPAAATNRKTKISPAPPRVFSSYRFLTHPYKKSRPPLGHAHQGSSIPCPRAPSATSGPMRRAARERDRRNSLRRNAENRKCHSEECRQHQNTCQLQGGWPWGISFPSRHD